MPRAHARPCRDPAGSPIVPGMTALTATRSQPPLSVTASPSLPRLVAAGLVATVGIAILSVAVGGYVVGSSHLHVASQADEARRLVGGTPMLAALGLLHLVGAIALARGGDLLRLGAALASGLMGIGAAASAVMLVAGIDPFGAAAGVAHASAGSLGLLIVAALAYGAAAVAAGAGPAEG